MRAPSFLLLTVLAFSGVACPGSSREVKLFFVDELVEAPAREASIIGLIGSDCETLLAIPHEQAKDAATVLFSRTARWPVPPDSEIFDDIPTDREILLLVAVYDSTQLLIARACQNINLADPATPEVELRALPACSNGPTQLDVTIVLDTSTEMEVVDPELLHLDELVPRVIEAQNYPSGTTWGIFTYGDQSGVAEALAPTTDVEAVRAAVQQLRMTHLGPARLWDGVYDATGKMRARALCGRRPALLLLAGSVDAGSARLREDASIGIFASRDDDSDDIYAHGIALSGDAYLDLDLLIPEGIGFVSGAENPSTRRQALYEAGVELRKLVP
jgi:hypothetical protein